MLKTLLRGNTVIRENRFWYQIVPDDWPSGSADIAGKWLCFGEKDDLHCYVGLLEKYVEDGTFRSVKLARKDTRTDPFPHKPCVLCVFTSGAVAERRTTKSKLLEIGLNPTQWKSESMTVSDWGADGKLHLEREVVRRKKQLAVGRQRAARRQQEVFDVFLCHNSSDKPIVRSIAQRLRNEGLSVWIDELELPPGTTWKDKIAKAICSVASVAICVGPAGLGPWQEKEVKEFLKEFNDRLLPVIPVLLPGLPKRPRLPKKLTDFTWVDFRSELKDSELKRLVWGITGKSLSASQIAADNFTGTKLSLQEVASFIGVSSAQMQTLAEVENMTFTTSASGDYEFVRDRFRSEFPFRAKTKWTGSDRDAWDTVCEVLSGLSVEYEFEHSSRESSAAIVCYDAASDAIEKELAPVDAKLCELRELANQIERGDVLVRSLSDDEEDQILSLLEESITGPHEATASDWGEYPSIDVDEIEMACDALIEALDEVTYTIATST